MIIVNLFILIALIVIHIKLYIKYKPSIDYIIIHKTKHLCIFYNAYKGNYIKRTYLILF